MSMNKAEQIMEDFRKGIEKIYKQYEVKELEELDTKELDEKISYEKSFIEKLETQGKEENLELIDRAKERLEIAEKEKAEKEKEYEEQKAKRKEETENVIKLKNSKVILPSGREVSMAEKDEMDRRSLQDKAMKELTQESKRISEELTIKNQELEKNREEKNNFRYEFEKDENGKSTGRTINDDEINRICKEYDDIKKEMIQLNEMQQECQKYLEQLRQIDNEKMKKFSEVWNEFAKEEEQISGGEEGQQPEESKKGDEQTNIGEEGQQPEESKKGDEQTNIGEEGQQQEKPKKDDNQKNISEKGKQTQNGTNKSSSNATKTVSNSMKEQGIKKAKASEKTKITLMVDNNKICIDDKEELFYKEEKKYGKKSKKDFDKNNIFYKDGKAQRKIDYALLNVINEIDSDLVQDYLKVIKGESFGKEEYEESKKRLTNALDIEYKFDKKGNWFGNFREKSIARNAKKIGIASLEGISEKSIFDKIKEGLSKIKNTNLLKGKEEQKALGSGENTRAQEQKTKTIDLINKDREIYGMRDSIKIDNKDNKIEKNAQEKQKEAQEKLGKEVSQIMQEDSERN